MKRKAQICAAPAACMVLSGRDNIGNLLKTHTGIISNNIANSEATKQCKPRISSENHRAIKTTVRP